MKKGDLRQRLAESKIASPCSFLTPATVGVCMENPSPQSFTVSQIVCVNGLVCLCSFAVYYPRFVCGLSPMLQAMFRNP